MLKNFILAASCAIVGFAHAHENDSLSNSKSAKVPRVNFVESRILNDTVSLFYVNNVQLFEEEWNNLAHPVFWRTIMKLSPDSCVINIGATRQIIKSMSVESWDKRSDDEKDVYRDSVRSANGLTSEDKVYMTTGKSDFYTFDNVLPTISKGVEVFKQQDVDPWYAQAILMIESPGRLAKSNVGAYGSFQLMASVARAQGLTVNKYRDDRKDFVKSAIGASSLIAKVCIPEAKVILDAKGIKYNENDLWFRLFVLHIYHAGAYNVAGVVNKINPSEGGMELIQNMWITSNGRFRNASQNYSQLALAAMLIFEDMLWDC
ncbi:transglycosylase SLT domain-containing protein [Brumimicrobium mesophilum]|uniref:transglycosylase SLT domain-containing protein n=1 Tax=Brumimicrobium mesophilum TaxID=392717 RepID=UPI000D1426F7|nr:transglycosylase SLT domain-containing protein [Brumimicrobium mesophilum]